MESPCGYVEVELADGDAEAADPEVAEAEDPAAVGHCVDGRERERERERERKLRILGPETLIITRMVS